ncbi:MAG: phage antirepressor KilAC domain-containing protein [Clostridiales bacterium]|nr:phage antirepressor KilAC domain-containing protein [Clostridiales bacterium]
MGHSFVYNKNIETLEKERPLTRKELLMVAQQQIMPLDTYILRVIYKKTPTKPTPHIPSLSSRDRTACINVESFAKLCKNRGIALGRNQMFRWLRECGIISKSKSTWNMPMQRYINLGVLRVKETFVIINDEQVPKFSPLITPKGQAYLLEKLMRRKDVG